MSNYDCLYMDYPELDGAVFMTGDHFMRTLPWADEEFKKIHIEDSELEDILFGEDQWNGGLLFLFKYGFPSMVIMYDKPSKTFYWRQFKLSDSKIAKWADTSAEGFWGYNVYVPADIPKEFLITCMSYCLNEYEEVLKGEPMDMTPKPSEEKETVSPKVREWQFPYIPLMTTPVTSISELATAKGIYERYGDPLLRKPMGLPAGTWFLDEADDPPKKALVDMMLKKQKEKAEKELEEAKALEAWQQELDDEIKDQKKQKEEDRLRFERTMGRTVHKKKKW